MFGNLRTKNGHQENPDDPDYNPWAALADEDHPDWNHPDFRARAKQRTNSEQFHDVQDAAETEDAGFHDRPRNDLEPDCVPMIAKAYLLKKLKLTSALTEVQASSALLEQNYKAAYWSICQAKQDLASLPVFLFIVNF